MSQTHLLHIGTRPFRVGPVLSSLGHDVWIRKEWLMNDRSGPKFAIRLDKLQLLKIRCMRDLHLRSRADTTSLMTVNRFWVVR